MAAMDGKDVVVKLTLSGSMARVCSKSKTVTIGGEPIDITQDCDNGFRKLMETASTRSIDIAVEGLMEGGEVLALLSDPTKTDFNVAGEITFPGLWTISGNFFITGFSSGAEIGAATTVSFTLQSSGAWTRAVPTP